MENVPESVWDFLATLHKNFPLSKLGWTVDQLGSLWISYEIVNIFSFVSVFGGLVLGDEKELDKNKIYHEYLLLEKMRFPVSFIV